MAFQFIKPNSSRAKWFIYIQVVFILLIIPCFYIFTYIVSAKPDLMFNIEGTDWNLGLTILWTSIFYPLSFYEWENGQRKLKMVPTGCIGQIQWAGQSFMEIGPGLVIIPPWFNLIIDSFAETALPIKLQNIDTGSAAEVKYEELGLNPEDYIDSDLNYQMTVGAEFSIYRKIKKGSYHLYLTNVYSDIKFIELVTDRAKEALAIEFSKRTTAIINRQREQICRSIEDKIQAESDSLNDTESGWGLRIRIKMIDLQIPENIVDGLKEKVMIKIQQFLDVTRAETSGKITRIDAKAQAFKTTSLGRSNARAEEFMLEVRAVGRRLILEAEAIGYGKIAKELNMDEGSLVLQLDTMKTVFKETLVNAQYSFLGPEISQMFGFVSLLKGAIDKIGPGR